MLYHGLQVHTASQDPMGGTIFDRVQSALGGIDPIIAHVPMEVECLQHLPVATPGGDHNTAVVILRGGTLVDIDRGSTGSDCSYAAIGLDGPLVGCTIIACDKEFLVTHPCSSQVWSLLTELRPNVAAEYGRVSR